MPIPLVDLQAQYASIKPQIDAAIARVLQTTAFAGGPEVEAFEKAFAAYCGSSECVALSSGTAALEHILRAYGIGAGDEVIIPSHTFFATGEAVSLVGAVPVMIDCEAETGLLDPALIEAAITAKTKAIIPVHLYGQTVDMEPILAIGKKHNLKVIEDACQAHGASYKGKRAGSLANSAAFSFYPGKNLGAYGEGGAVTTNDLAVAAHIRLLREHGSKTKYEHKIVGRNDRMDGLQGAVLATKLPFLDQWNTKRRAHAQTYRELLKDDAHIRIVGERPGSEHVYHLFVVRIANRDQVRSALNAQGIGAAIHYPIPLHLQEVYKDLGYKKGSLPHSETLAAEILSLPLYPEMTETQIGEVVTALTKAVSGKL